MRLHRSAVGSEKNPFKSMQTVELVGLISVIERTIVRMRAQQNQLVKSHSYSGRSLRIRSHHPSASPAMAILSRHSSATRSARVLAAIGAFIFRFQNREPCTIRSEPTMTAQLASSTECSLMYLILAARRFWIFTCVRGNDLCNERDQSRSNFQIDQLAQLPTKVSSIRRKNSRYKLRYGST
jgi:hypothetical protein